VSRTNQLCGYELDSAGLRHDTVPSAFVINMADFRVPKHQWALDRLNKQRLLLEDCAEQCYALISIPLKYLRVLSALPRDAHEFDLRANRLLEESSRTSISQTKLPFKLTSLLNI
jgi:hypothetical protein